MAHALDRQRGMAVRLASSATGDLANNVDRLRHELQQSKYAGNINARAWRQGDPADLLPLIHFALLGYSKHVHDALAATGEGGQRLDVDAGSTGGLAQPGQHTGLVVGDDHEITTRHQGSSLWFLQSAPEPSPTTA